MMTLRFLLVKGNFISFVWCVICRQLCVNRFLYVQTVVLHHRRYYKWHQITWTNRKHNIIFITTYNRIPNWRFAVWIKLTGIYTITQTCNKFVYQKYIYAHTIKLMKYVLHRHLFEVKRNCNKFFSVFA